MWPLLNMVIKNQYDFLHSFKGSKWEADKLMTIRNYSMVKTVVHQLNETL